MTIEWKRPGWLVGACLGIVCASCGNDGTDPAATADIPGLESTGAGVGGNPQDAGTGGADVGHSSGGRSPIGTDGTGGLTFLEGSGGGGVTGAGGATGGGFTESGGSGAQGTGGWIACEEGYVREGDECVLNDAAEPPEMVGMVAAHNAVRAAATPPNGVPLEPVVWSAEVAASAQAWADDLASRGCPLEHSPRDWDAYGENIYMGGLASEPEQVVDLWASEESCYNDLPHSDPGWCSCEMCGHYTQLVWRTTARIGCGVGACGRQEIWVCQYDPPGNWIGEMPY